MLAKVLSAAIVGLDAIPVEVEVDIASQGLPSFTIVGLLDNTVEEAKERVQSLEQKENYVSSEMHVDCKSESLPMWISWG